MLRKGDHSPETTVDRSVPNKQIIGDPGAGVSRPKTKPDLFENQRNAPVHGISARSQSSRQIGIVDQSSLRPRTPVVIGRQRRVHNRSQQPAMAEGLGSLIL
jgi:hypothetical protein